MRQVLMTVEGKSAVLLIALIVIVVIFAVLFVFWCLTRCYLKKHKAELFGQTKPLSENCKILESELQEDFADFQNYIHEMGLDKEYVCSRSIVSNAQDNEIKYLLKYSNIEYTEDCLYQIEFCINWLWTYHAAMDDMYALARKILGNMPVWVRIFCSRKVSYLICDVPYDFAKVNLPVFSFVYVSPAGNSCHSFEIKITEAVLEDIRSFMCDKMSKSAYAKMQRNAMTKELREAIKMRDNYTCCICGNSVYNEPNLLLEVDHIVPIAKGGRTEADNLQTLCWKCNRRKRDMI